MTAVAADQLAGDVFAECSAVRCLPISVLVPADSPRRHGEDLAHTSMLARVDGPLPPIIVHRPTLRVIDGMHRLGAALLRGDETIEVRFFDGSDQEAFVLGVRANIAHGLPLQLADRARAARRILASHPAWSDRAIARVTGLGARTVGKIRHRLPREADDAGARSRMSLDGRIRPVNGVEGRLRASEVIKRRPDASLREVAREAGVSPTTVRDVRARIARGEDPAARLKRRPTAPQADPAGDGPELDSMLRGLLNDPALRYTDTGRALLRWMNSRAIRSNERLDVAARVPPHCTYLVATVARSCAHEWLRLAEELERGSARPA